jgi:hypothetical protein
MWYSRVDGVLEKVRRVCTSADTEAEEESGLSVVFERFLLICKNASGCRHVVCFLSIVYVYKDREVPALSLYQSSLFSSLNKMVAVPAL